MLDSLDTLISFALIMLLVSLLITIAVQMVAAAFNLRGMNLANGLADTLETIVPGTKGQAKEFVNHVLQSPMISDSCAKWIPQFWRRATAVRPDEVFDAIYRIALGRQDTPDHLRNYAQSLLTALGIDKKSLEDAATALSSVGKPVKNIVDTANDAITAIPDENLRSKLKTALAGVTNQLQAYATAEANQLTQGAYFAKETVDNAYNKFKFLSDTCQERVQQWFTMHTRVVTLIFAIVFAFGLQLDTVEIYKLVSTNRTVRDKLVAQATTATSQAEKILSDSKSVQKEALATFIAKQKDEKTKAALKTALETLPVEEFETRKSLGEKVKAALASKLGKGSKPVGDYDSAVDETVTNRLKKQAGDFKAIKSDLDQTGFELIPSAKSGRWREGWWAWDVLKKHLIGILFSAALLSLGGPFWFNILKSLTSLRSAVARNISEEQKQAREKTESIPTAKAPPTVAPPQ